MTTETRQLVVSDIPVEVVRKEIKNLHLGVYPPEGRVRVAAPRALSDEAVRLAVVGKLPWIRRQRARFEAQPRETERAMVDGESHYYLGRRYRLRVRERDAAPSVAIRGVRWIELTVRPGATPERRAEALAAWYRTELRRLLPEIIDRWATALGVPVPTWGIKRMKTKWGSCSVKARRVWLNLELIKQPPWCIDYVVLHELAHLVVPTHDARFTGLLDRHMPGWAARRAELNGAVLAAEEWGGVARPTTTGRPDPETARR